VLKFKLLYDFTVPDCHCIVHLLALNIDLFGDLGFVFLTVVEKVHGKSRITFFL